MYRYFGCNTFKLIRFGKFYHGKYLHAAEELCESFNSKFDAQNNNTNQNKSRFINNLDYSTNEAYNNDIGVSYKFLTRINNINYYSDYGAPKENLNNEINPILGFDTALPFAKISKESEQYLIPRILTRYSPGNMIKSSTNTTMLTTDNLFSLNRMNSDELIEKDLKLLINWQISQI